MAVALGAVRFTAHGVVVARDGDEPCRAGGRYLCTPPSLRASPPHSLQSPRVTGSCNHMGPANARTLFAGKPGLAGGIDAATRAFDMAAVSYGAAPAAAIVFATSSVGVPSPAALSTASASATVGAAKMH